MNDKQAYEKMISITRYSGNANWSHDEMLLCISTVKQQKH